jgi:hypothetical protein
MNKRQLIGRIVRYNNRVEASFLAQFDQASLKQYLQHLKVAQERKPRVALWIRQDPSLRMVS